MAQSFARNNKPHDLKSAPPPEQKKHAPIPPSVSRHPSAGAKAEALIKSGEANLFARTDLSMHYFLRAATQGSEQACTLMTHYAEGLKPIVMTCQLEFAALYTNDNKRKLHIANMLCDFTAYFINDYDHLIPTFPERAIELAIFASELGHQPATNLLAGFKKKYPASYQLCTTAKEKMQRILDEKGELPSPENFNETYNSLKHIRYFHRYRHQLIQRLQAIADKNKDYAATLANIYLQEAALVDTWNEAESLFHYQAAAYYFNAAKDTDAAQHALYLYAVKLYDCELRLICSQKQTGHTSFEILLALEQQGSLDAQTYLLTRIEFNKKTYDFQTLATMLGKAAHKNNFSAAQIILTTMHEQYAEQLKQNIHVIATNFTFIARIGEKNGFHQIKSLLKFLEKYDAKLHAELLTHTIVNIFDATTADWKKNDVAKNYSRLASTYDSVSPYIDLLQNSVPHVRKSNDAMEEQLVTLYNTKQLTDDDINPTYSILGRAGSYAKKLQLSATHKNHLWALTKQFQYHQQKNNNARACFWAMKIALHPDTSTEQRATAIAYINTTQSYETNRYSFSLMRKFEHTQRRVLCCALYKKIIDEFFPQDQKEPPNKSLESNVRNIDAVLFRAVDKLDEPQKMATSSALKSIFVEEEYPKDAIDRMFRPQQLPDKNAAAAPSKT